MGLVGHTFYPSMYKEDLYELKASWSAYDFQDCWQYIERHCSKKEQQKPLKTKNK